MPKHAEASIDATGAWQSFRQYGTSGGSLPTGQVNATLGNRNGGWSYWLSASHLDNEAQPLGFATLTRPASPSAGGIPVTGAFADQSRTGAPIEVIGATGIEHQRQDNAKLKLAYDFTPQLRATYTLGLFDQDNHASADTYLRDAQGNPVYAGSVNIDGYSYNVPASAFANGVYDYQETHSMQSLVLKSTTNGAFDGEAVVSYYDFDRDRLSVPSAALPDARGGGPGTITSMDGSGWWTVDLKGYWRPQGTSGAHQVSFGLHYDRYKLASPKYATTDWQTGDEGALTSDAEGKTETSAVWLQDAWRFAPSWKATLGARYEWWKAFDGYNYSLSPTLSVRQPSRDASRLSPKAALAWFIAPDWEASAAFGVGYRFPTVSELYQTVTTGPDLTVPDPDLRPEHARSTEIALARVTDRSRLRLSWFTEDLRDGLLSQTAPLVPGSSTLYSYVQNIDRIRSRGVELVASADDFGVPGLSLTGSVTYVDSSILADAAFPAAVGKQTPNIPRWRWTLVASYRPNDRWTTTLAVRHSDRVYSALDNSDIYTHTYQGFDSYLVVDARIHYRIDRHWSVATGIDNLTDDRYFLYHPFPQRTVVAEIKYAY